MTTTPTPTAPSAMPDRVASPTLRWLAVASLAVNILIVVTGGVVRLTGSGLGCPTWPECTAGSLTPHGAMGIHAAIEFSNRLVTFLIAAVAIATLVVAWRTRRRAVRWIAIALFLGVPAQAVLGGITVRTGLNPWVVSLHLVLSMAMICLATLLVRRVDEPDVPATPTVVRGVRWLVYAVFAAGWAVLYLGTVVTGSGPHAGDVHAVRNGLDPRAATQLHTDLVFLLVGLTLGVVLVLRSVDAPARTRDAATLLLAVELAQGVVGFVQYFTGLPVLLVSAHLLGAALLAAAMTWLLLGTRERVVSG